MILVVSLLAAASAGGTIEDSDSVDVCRHPEMRTLHSNITKYCGSIERVIVSCFGAARPTFFGTIAYSFVPEVVPGTAVVSVLKEKCTATVQAIVSRGFQPLVLVDSLQQRLIARQFVLRYKGEVFESHECPSLDPQQITVFRAHSADRRCKWLHFLQFAKFLWDLYPASAREQLLRAKPAAEVRAIAHRKSRFAAFGFGKFRLDMYHGDFVVRHAFVELLRRRGIGDVYGLGALNSANFARDQCAGDFTQMRSCLAPYRFAIVMENSNFPGYVSEKLLNAFLAQSVPVYFGAEDVTRYFNEQAMIVCRVPPAEIETLRAAHKGNYPMLARKSNSSDIVDWAIEIIGQSLRDCLDRVERVAVSEDDYLALLMAHPLAQLRSSRTYVDGYDVSCQLVRILEASGGFFAPNSTRASACERELDGG